MSDYYSNPQNSPSQQQSGSHAYNSQYETISHPNATIDSSRYASHTVGENVALCHGEELKRIFPMCYNRRGANWILSRLVVTDSRVMYQARSRNFLNKSSLFQEIKIEDVAGINFECRKGMTVESLAKISIFFLFWLSLILTFENTGRATSSRSYGNYATASTSNGQWSGESVAWLFILLAITITLIIRRMLSKEIALIIKSKNPVNEAIAIAGLEGKQGQAIKNIVLFMLAAPIIILMEFLGVVEAKDAFESADTETAQEIYDELGALILDLQQRGVYGG